MQVKKINGPVVEKCPEIKPMTDEQLQHEYDFMIADKLIGKMAGIGIIPKQKVNKIRRSLAKEFSTFLADLLP
ncbi:hypothetical protein [Galactobacillus timonensis]|uniref:hypothetical protein n=1 Tax=Galactobacillus timonensis TaxID=2041840 RepID=UPI000C84ABB0|nr:hypothetical protein [Galactobacillus timonensis]